MDIAEVTQEIQIGMFGRTAAENEDQVAFAYPLYTVYTIGPMALLPYPQAQALWQALLQFSVIGATVLTIRFVGLRLRPLALALLVLWSILFYPDMRGFVLGQYAIVVYLSLAASLLAVQRGRDTLGGFLLAWTTIKPQMVIFLIPYLLLWTAWQRRWRFPLAFGTTLLFLAGSAMLLVPTWPADFVAATLDYQRYTQAAFDGKPTLKHLTDFIFGASGHQVYLGASLVLAIMMLSAWYRSLSRAPVGFELTLSLTVIMTTLFPVDQATTNQILLLLPVLLTLRILARIRFGSVWGVLLALILLVVPWIFFFSTFTSKTENTLQFILLPLPILFLTIGVYLHLSKLSPN